TLDDTLHEGLDVDGLRSLWERIEGGSVRVHCVDTTEASVLSHEIITARPYAFLDDEEFQNRRTNAVQLRRGLAVDLGSIGALDPLAIETVQAEIVPSPLTPDDLHDLLSSWVVARPREGWRELWEKLVAAGRGVTLLHEGEVLWCATECAEEAQRAFRGDEVAAARLVQGHLELLGITTAKELVAATGLSAPDVDIALAQLQGAGFVLQGHYRAVGTDGAIEWAARRILARMHSYSRRTRRENVQPATAQDFMRFLLRWQHVAPGTVRAGERGLASVLEQLQGFEAASAAWERELLARRVRDYDPAWLDRMCHEGEVAWLRLSPPPRRDGEVPLGVTSKATPIAVVNRADLPWLVATRGEQGPLEPAVGATAEIVEELRERGASFASDLVSATRRLPDDVERGLWQWVAGGLLMCDGFA
ncbi:MAG: Lhr family ATP-dependent helicase, partial [Acidimicrobiales bacterium]